ncbi:hypothetical protein H4Q32_025692 [Labeo rohita]|uniref:CCHC-type domain-containing protein n=1 Tax=Labeo rohita TaxID=84645 RepID=A0ABQ8L9S3_LABRO|nr:hypothetical protein H4Q32_025692 [Labeo rohita]
MEGHKGKDKDTATETGRQHDKGPGKGLQAENGKNTMEIRRVYLKEATITIDVAEVQNGGVQDVIKAIEEKVGEGKILAVRPKQHGLYEVTLENEELCEELLDGLEIKGIKCETKKLQDREYVVSFMHLPAYLEDILDKLEGWRVIPTSQIRRRYYPGTNIEDGTRFVKVKFPREVASLPYSTRFGTAEGMQHFRIIHSQQVKTCRLCMSPHHILKDCPEFTCYKCEEQGHFARDCTAVKCPDCFKILNKCECWMNDGEEEEDRGQMLKEAMETKAASEAEEQQEVAIEEEKGNGKEPVNTNEGEKSVEKESFEEGVWTPADIATNTMDKHNAAENSQNMDMRKMKN